MEGKVEEKVWSENSRPPPSHNYSAGGGGGLNAGMDQT
jgi:hypothetical protein